MYNNAISIFFSHVLIAIQQSGKTPEEVAAKIKNAGISGVDLFFDEYVNQDTYEVFKRTGFDVPCLIAWCDFQKNPDSDIVERQLETAKAVSAKKMLMVPGFVTPDDPFSGEKVINGQRRMTDVCLKNGIDVFIEDFGSLSAPYGQADQVLSFLEKCPGLKACFDTGNFECFRESIPHAYGILNGHIGYVHCKDHSYKGKISENATFEEYAQNLTSEAIGEGDLPVEDFVKTMVRNGYKDGFAIEHFNVPNMLDCIERSAKNIRKWLAEA